MKKLVIILGTLLFLAPAVLAQGDSSSATGQAAATIIKPISCAKVADLDFGTIISNASDGSVTVKANGGAQTDQGGATIFEPGNRASFTVKGEAEYQFNLTYDSQVELTNGANSMTATLESDLEDGGSLDGNGDATFHIGGTLAVPGDSASGDYLGTFQVTVSYP